MHRIFILKILTFKIILYNFHWNKLYNKFIMIKVLIVLFFTFFIDIAKADLAVVNTQEVLNNSLVFIDATKTFNKEKDEYQKKFSDKEAMLMKEKDNIITRSSILSQQDMQKEVEIFQQKISDFQIEIRDTETKLQQKTAQVLSKLSDELKIIISEMLKEKVFSKYDKVVDSSVMLYFDPKDDITKDVLQRLNKKFKTLKSLEK